MFELLGISWYFGSGIFFFQNHHFIDILKIAKLLPVGAWVALPTISGGFALYITQGDLHDVSHASQEPDGIGVQVICGQDVPEL